MSLDLKSLLEAIGPNASLIFAAWIFLSFLQSRYSEAFKRYRELAEDYRQAGHDERRQSLERMIRLYKRRCDWMRWATNMGVVSAILLILTLVLAGLNNVFPGYRLLPPVAAGTALVGLLMVGLSASTVLVENTSLARALEEELVDLPGFEGRGSR